MKKIYLILSMLVFSFSSVTFAEDYSSYEYEEYAMDPVPVGPTACGPKPVKPGGSWQTCTCKCNTVDGDTSIQCWVQLLPGSQPDVKNCSNISGSCTANGKKGMWRGCTMP